MCKHTLEWGIAEELKTILRRKYAQAVRQSLGESNDRFLSRSQAFWEEYESLNRQWIPDDPVYSGNRSGVALSTTADLWTLSSPSAGQVRILESYISGEATSSASCRVAVQRSTGGTTPSNQTPEKFNTRSPAASSTFATTWSAQPTLSGNPTIMQVFNAFGGSDRWVPSPGEEIYLVNAEILSCRSSNGTSTVSAHVIWEEM